MPGAHSARSQIDFQWLSGILVTNVNYFRNLFEPLSSAQEPIQQEQECQMRGKISLICPELAGQIITQTIDRSTVLTVFPSIVWVFSRYFRNLFEPLSSAQEPIQQEQECQMRGKISLICPELAGQIITQTIDRSTVLTVFPSIVWVFSRYFRNLFEPLSSAQEPIQQEQECQMRGKISLICPELAGQIITQTIDRSTVLTVFPSIVWVFSRYFRNLFEPLSSAQEPIQQEQECQMRGKISQREVLNDPLSVYDRIFRA
ncbi:hypothetical protein BDZ97DRAFT_1751475 [Flammula alnicola]|nr:hypothetical protein BDZ97DRAFT_1751475 [Flammula alnicola]